MHFSTDQEHKVKKYLILELTRLCDADPVVFADYVFARYAANWRMNDKMTWGFDAFVEDAKESGGAALSAEHTFRSSRSSI